MCVCERVRESEREREREKRVSGSECVSVLVCE